MIWLILSFCLLGAAIWLVAHVLGKVPVWVYMLAALLALLVWATGAM